MTLHQLFTILAARWRSATVALLCTVVLGLLLTLLLLPKQYTASAAVMIVQSPDPTSSATPAGAQPGYIATQVDLAGSERVVRRAVESLGLHRDAELQDLWRDKTRGVGEFEAWLAERVQKKLDIEPSRDSSVIRIGYVAREGAQAAAMANAIMQAYIETVLDMRVEPARAYNQFYDERAKQLRQQVEAAQAGLLAYQRQNGLLATDERLDIENARLSELNSQFVTAQAQAADSSGRSMQAGSRPEEMSEVLTDPLVGALQTELVREQSKLRDLATRLGDRHPQILQQRAAVAELRQRVNTAVQRASGSVGVTAGAQRERVAQLGAMLEAQRAKVMHYKSLRDGAAVLQRDVENAQRAYDAMQTRVSLTSVESVSTLSNVGVIKRASEPADPSFPKLAPSLAAAGLLGLLIALVTALLRELFDRRLRSSEDVLAELKLPLLVTLPLANHLPRQLPADRVEQTKHRVLAGLTDGNAGT